MTRRGNAPPAGRREIEVEAMSDQIAQFFREHNIQEVEAIVPDRLQAQVQPWVVVR